MREQQAIEQFRQDREGNEPRILKDSYGNAARDGYTCLGRRVRWDEPGEIVDEKEAEAIDSMMSEHGIGPASY